MGTTRNRICTVTLATLEVLVVGCGGSVEEDSMNEGSEIATTVETLATATTASAASATTSRTVTLPGNINPSLVACPASYTYPSYTHKFKDGASFTNPRSLNNRGVVVGELDPSINQLRQGFVRHPGGAIQVFASNEAHVTATGVNDLGKMVGSAGNTGFFGAIDNAHRRVGYEPYGINNRGDVIGLHNSGEGFVMSGADQHITNLGKFKPLAINNYGQIIGHQTDETADNPAGAAKVRDPDGRMTPLRKLFGTFAAYPTSINDVGQIAGIYHDGGRTRGFVFDANGAVTLVDSPNASRTYIGGINNLGHVAGWAAGADEVHVNFVRSRDGVFNYHFVGGRLGATSVEGLRINDLGQEIGRFVDAETRVQTGFLAGPFFIEPLGRLSITKTDIALNSGGVAVWGKYTTCATRQPNPLVDPVILKVFHQDVGAATVAIPMGSFQYEPGKYEFHGVLHGMTIDAFVWGPLANNTWDFRISASGVSGLPNTPVVEVSLAVGSSTGSTSTNATFLP